MTLSVGDLVVVEQLDGERSEAVVAALPEETVAEYEYTTQYGTKTLYESWRGADVPEDEAVVEVRYVKGVSPVGDPRTYSKQTYGFPRCQVEAGLDAPEADT